LTYKAPPEKHTRRLFRRLEKHTRRHFVTLPRVTVLGIDAGGTKTVCMLADEHGRVLAEARGPGANLQAAGAQEVERVLRELIETAIGRGGGATPAAIGLGMAGVDRPRDAETIHAILGRIGHRARALVVNDALIALEAGVGDAAGVVVVAGTGSIAYGRDSRGRAARSGGWGYVLGDEGSGYWIGRQALRAVVRAADGRGEETALTRRILAHYGVTRPQDLVREIYQGGAEHRSAGGGGSQPAAIASLAREVEAAALEDDPVAQRILAIGAIELADAAASVAARLGLTACAIVLAGRVLLSLETLRSRLIARLVERLPDSTPKLLDAEPAHGAVRLAIAAARGRLAVPSYLDAVSE
jgi:N-acetylglucosamine kinase-like BadF-type ATPase